MDGDPGDNFDVPLEQLLAAVGQAVIATDLEGRVVYWNPAAERMYGWPTSEALGRPASELIVPVAHVADGREIFESVSRGDTWRGRCRLRRRDGSEVDALVTDAPIRDRAGTVVGVIGVSTDITEQVRADDARRLSEELARRRFTDAPIAQAILAPDGTIERVNPALCAAVQLHEEEIVGRSVFSFVHPAGRDAARRAFEDALKGREGAASAPVHYVADAGHTVWGLTSIIVIRDDAGEPHHVATFIQDITEVHRARTAEAAALERLQASEARLRALVHRSADVALILDAEARVTFASPAVEQVFGFPPEALVGGIGFGFVHPDDVPAAREVLGQVLARPGAHPPFEMRLLASDGGYVWTEAAVTNSLDDPAINGLVLNLRDVTARRAAVAALAESELRYRTIVETADEGIWVIDANSRTTFANPRLAEMLGRPEAEILGRKPTDFAHPDQVDQLRAQLALATAGQRRTVRDAVLPPRRVAPVGAHLRAPALRRDEPLSRHARDGAPTSPGARRWRSSCGTPRCTTSCTGLANRTLLTDRVEQAVVRTGRRAGLVAVLFIDVDQFKLVNDSLGHTTGDSLLVEVADRIRGAVRADDTVARFGGDEFVVLCEGLHDREEALEVAGRVLDAVSQPVHLAGRPMVVTCSVGVAFSPAETGDALLRDADIAMYRAKEQGRARVETFDPRLDETARLQFDLASDLREALRGGEGLEAYYQPIVSVPDQSVIGAEALVRWHHPTRGLLAPDAFIPIAERVGLIQELDALMLGEACRQAAGWIAAGDVPETFAIAVNLSARQLGAPGSSTW